MNIKLTEVKDEVEFKIWYALFREVFSKDEDAFPYEQMKSWWPHNICLFMEVDNQKVGFIFERVLPEYKCGMIFYAGLKEEFRGKGIYPKLMPTNEKLLLERGAEIFISESEEPTFYSDEKERHIALKRLNAYVSKMNRSFIKNSPEVKYLRPVPPAEGADVSHEVQENYLLGFKVLGNPEGFDFFDQNLKNKITKKDFRKLFFLENRLEQGKELDELRNKIHAIDLFLKNLENTKKETFDLINQDTWDKYLRENNLDLNNI